ncbi:MAG: hypothetical protein BA870_11915 [Desulfuromonadales bacterium C00003094]|jgi:hypothetical protein|nr:MAG: hypothetical protein BA870_11915 [Desulfuromonadales bacterium C00003094]OEU73065.1 MAG: hypothetical protein BA869_00795 [Desulfuromonadales bacterium C00003107]
MADETTFQAITEHLRCLSDPATAEQSQRFFKTGEGQYGYGDWFLGIRVPILWQAVKKYRHTPLNVAERLLKSEFHEIRLFALLLLVENFAHGDKDAQTQIHRTYLAHTRYVNNWDLTTNRS